MSSSFTDIQARPELPPQSFPEAIMRGWNRFWFTPADPIVLGLIRLCCGLLAFYTVATYSYELQNFFGENAWLNLTARRESTKNMAITLDSLNWPRGQLGDLQNSLNLTQEQALKLQDYIMKVGNAPPKDYSELYVHLSEDQVAKLKYIESYYKHWQQYPPLPFPKNDAEAAAIDHYIVTWGVDPRLTFSRGAPEWSVWFHVTDPQTMVIVHCLFVLVTFLFAIGFCTRLTSVLAWFAALSYVHRSPITLFGVDTMMIILMAYLMIGPSGATLSVDRLIANWWRRRHGGTDQPVRPSLSANFAIRLLQIHVCFVYAGAGFSKLQGTSWWNGTAIWGTLANSEFAPVNSEFYMWLLRGMASNLWLVQTFLTVGTYFTLFFEIGYSFMIWGKYTRWLMLTMALMLHGVIGTLMGLQTFALMMVVMNMAFLPPETVRWALALLRGTPTPPAERSVPALADKPTATPELAAAGAGSTNVTASR